MVVARQSNKLNNLSWKFWSRALHSLYSGKGERTPKYYFLRFFMSQYNTGARYCSWDVQDGMT